MELAWRAVAAVARVAIWIGGALLFAAAAIVSAEVRAAQGARHPVRVDLRLFGVRRNLLLPVRGRHLAVDGARAGDARPRAHRCALRLLQPPHTRAARSLRAGRARHFRGSPAGAGVGCRMHQLHRADPLQHAAQDTAGLGAAALVRRHCPLRPGAGACRAAHAAWRCCAATMPRRPRPPAP